MTRELLDSHLHTWEQVRHPQPWIDPRTMGPIDRDFTLADADQVTRACGATGFLVVHGANSAAETADLLDGVAQTPSARGLVGWVDLTADVPAALTALAGAPGAAGLVGVRHLTHLEPDPAWLLRPDVGAGIDAVTAAGLAVDLVVRPDQLTVAAQVADRHPGARLVLDHLGKPPLRAGGDALDRWAVDLGELARRDNVAAKVSGLAIEDDWAAWTPRGLARVVDEALGAFGPDRLMFGSDWPLVELTGGYAAWREAYLTLTADLGPDERARIDSGTAREVYGLRDG